MQERGRGSRLAPSTLVSILSSSSATALLEDTAQGLPARAYVAAADGHGSARAVGDVQDGCAVRLRHADPDAAAALLTRVFIVRVPKIIRMSCPECMSCPETV